MSIQRRIASAILAGLVGVGIAWRGRPQATSVPERHDLGCEPWYSHDPGF